MAKKKKNIMSKTINGNDLLLNSANKLNKSMPVVYSGTGGHGKNKYNRKKKHKNRGED